jgi:hypothetical protein
VAQTRCWQQLARAGREAGHRPGAVKHIVLVGERSDGKLSVRGRVIPVRWYGCDKFFAGQERISFPLMKGVRGNWCSRVGIRQQLFNWLHGKRADGSAKLSAREESVSLSLLSYRWNWSCTVRRADSGGQLLPTLVFL